MEEYTATASVKSNHFLYSPNKQDFIDNATRWAHRKFQLAVDFGDFNSVPFAWTFSFRGSFEGVTRAIIDLSIVGTNDLALFKSVCDSIRLSSPDQNEGASLAYFMLNVENGTPLSRGSTTSTADKVSNWSSLRQCSSFVEGTGSNFVTFKIVGQDRRIIELISDLAEMYKMSLDQVKTFVNSVQSYASRA